MVPEDKLSPMVFLIWGIFASKAAKRSLALNSCSKQDNAYPEVEAVDFSIADRAL